LIICFWGIAVSKENWTVTSGAGVQSVWEAQKAAESLPPMRTPATEAGLWRIDSQN
jgi:hypothetical protein